MRTASEVHDNADAQTADLVAGRFLSGTKAIFMAPEPMRITLLQKPGGCFSMYRCVLFF